MIFFMPPRKTKNNTQDVPRAWLDSIAVGHNASAVELRDGATDL
jgi:hypothetical protein